MKTRPNGLRRLVMMLMLGYLTATIGCAATGRAPTSALDTPEHHLQTGNDLLAKGDIAGAADAFGQAIELDPKYSPAFYGLAMALVEQKDYDPAQKALKSAKRFAATRSQEAMAEVGFIRLETRQQDKGWVERVKTHYHRALGADKSLPDVYFYKGMADKEALAFADAEAAFEQVLKLDAGKVEEADAQFKKVQKIVRAMPGTEVGKKLALVDAMTRADVAAIFVHELRLEKLLARSGKAVKSGGSKVRDIADHPLRTDIETVMGLDIRGLEAGHENRFYPDRKITRAEYALMIEDIIAGVAQEADLRTRYIGQTSPFPDVASSAPYFNAVMTCTSRGIMTATDVLTGEFTPRGPVSGAEALLVIRTLREKLRVF